MLRKSLIILFSHLLLFAKIYSQIPGFHIDKGLKKLEIPFERQDNFIVLKVLFQGFFPLRFILDTGAEHTILTKKEITNLLHVTYDREITIMGTDMKTQIKAYIARKVQMEISGLTLVKDILVLDEDYFKFDQFSGMDVQGILGAETFKGYVLKIDYYKQILTIYDPSVFKPSDYKRFVQLPIETLRSKPYIRLNAQIKKDTTVNLKLLLDTGAALSLLLHTYSAPGLVLPQQIIKGNIGNGLGGQIEGYLGRIHSLKVGNYNLGNFVSHFQELNNDSDSSYINGRNGLVGSDILSRFTVIIDFHGDKAYFQPNKHFNTKFNYDKSGLVVVAGGSSLNQFTVYDIDPNTPASEADIRKGDAILSINHIPTRLSSLSTLNFKFQKKAGKKVRLVIRRNGEKLIKTIVLRDLI
jgi:PDZ domain/Aspartyl protease